MAIATFNIRSRQVSQTPHNQLAHSLPYNRGSHPLFWSYFDQTPLGVTIHQIDEGIDTGPILLRELNKNIHSQMTFSEAYQLLIVQIEQLFLNHWKELSTEQIVPTPQTQTGTYHKKLLTSPLSGWLNSIIDDALSYLKGSGQVG